MDMATLPKNTPNFSQETVSGTPLLINLAEIQSKGHQTLEEYIEYILLCLERPISVVIPVADTCLFSQILTVTSTDGRALTGFWSSPFCGKHCTKEMKPHPCIDKADSVTDCDLFCLGFSPEEPGEENDLTRNLTKLSPCQTDHRGELVSCGILAIVLHYQHLQDGRRVLVSVELSIGCNKRQQSVLVIQHQPGLVFSLK